MAIREERRSIYIEGGLFGPEFLDRVERGEAPFQRPKDFGVATSLQEVIAGAYEDARVYWGVFKPRIEDAGDRSRRAELTRERWVRPLLSLLGYRIDHKGWVEAGEKKYPILYRADERDDSPPVHIVSWDQDLGRATRQGRRSPHGVMQEYLNVSDDLWGIVTNGRKLRLLRATPFVRRQAYLEVDLDALMESDLPGEFALLYRLLHRSRLPEVAALADKAPIEVYYREALEQGERARERLRDLVEAFLRELGTGLLRDSSTEAREALAQDPQRFYEDLLRLTYRILFLLVAEARNTLTGNEYYQASYSISRLLRLGEGRDNFTEDRDLWHGLRALFLLLRENNLRVNDGKPPASLLDLAVLNGKLFAPIRLDAPDVATTNAGLLRAFRNLAYYYDEKSRVTRRVNYAALDVEELGSVYEGLLDYQPRIGETRGGELYFELVHGDARKRTGSYYTPESLVGATLREALDPVVEERLSEAATPEEKERAILSLKIVDPAAGSGHFLLGAARRLGRRLAQVRTGDEEPEPAKVREAVRDVIQHCIYGVDKNPLAVELCRVALWIESYVPGKPLTFLDHRIKVGDSLVGVLEPEVLEKGIPDGAFNPRLGEKAETVLARSLRKKNAKERAGEQDLFTEAALDLKDFAEEALGVVRGLAIPDDSVETIRTKDSLYASWREHPHFNRLRLASDLWTGAFFQALEGNGPLITTSTVRSALSGQVDPGLEKLAAQLVDRHRFFHWWLEFPEVFLDPSGRLKKDAGFDAVLGNPPWEVVQPEEEKFFRGKDGEIAEAKGNTRKQLIKTLPNRNPELAKMWAHHVRDIHALANFIATSGRFPLTSRGKKNLYAAFAEHARHVLGPGRSGMLVPTGIATDDTNKHFFAEVVAKGELAALLDFENREALFPNVHRSYKFSIFSLQKPGDPARPARLLFFAPRVEHLADERRIFTLTPDDFALLNPNTKTCPTFRTKADAELTKAVYRRVPILIREAHEEPYVPSGQLLPDDRPLVPKTLEVPEQNPWGVTFRQGLFNMTSDSHLFKTRAELESQGFSLRGNRFEKAGEVYLPLYEAKMIWQFDHRFATYDPGTDRTRDTLPEEHADPAYQPKPRYWVPATEVEARLEQKDREGRLLWRWERGWLLGFRDITNSTNERTAIFSLVPRVGVGNNCPLMFTDVQSGAALSNAVFVANWNSLVLDYIAKLKIPATHMNFHFVKQFPILRPSDYTPEDLRFLVPRVLELVYTAWDLAPFARDVWEELSDPNIVPPELAEGIRKEIARRFAEHHGLSPEEARNHARFAPPGWFHGEYPFPPFGWSEDRRALVRAELDAYYARRYGLNRKQLRYILDPQDLTERELETLVENDWEEVKDPLDPSAYEARTKASGFPTETFRVLKDKEEKTHGEYRTRRLTLEAWERLADHGATKPEGQTRSS